MKERPKYFIAEDKIDHNGEIFDYIKELHEYLWRFVRAVIPGANGSLSDYIDAVIEKAEAERDRPELRQVVRIFAQSMEKVLQANDHKGGWGIDDCSLEYLEARLIEEVGEYFADKANQAYEPTELVDIANFAMMIWDRRGS